MSDVFGKTLDFFWKISDVFLRKSLNFIRSLDSNSGWLWRLWKQKVHHRCSVRTRARNLLLCLRCFGKLSQRALQVNWDFPSLLLRHQILFCIAAQVSSYFRPTNPPFQQWRAVRSVKEEETIREKTLFKVLFVMCMYQNWLFVKKKVQFSAYFSLLAPSSTPICVGRWMKRKWGYEEE